VAGAWRGGYQRTQRARWTGAGAGAGATRGECPPFKRDRYRKKRFFESTSSFLCTHSNSPCRLSNVPFCRL